MNPLFETRSLFKSDWGTLRVTVLRSLAREGRCGRMSGMPQCLCLLGLFSYLAAMSAVWRIRTRYLLAGKGGGGVKEAHVCMTNRKGSACAPAASALRSLSACPAVPR